MSHFTVLVIGNDVDAQLAPFHEFECTGVDDQYIQNVDITEEFKENAVDDDGKFSMKEGLDYYGYKLVKNINFLDLSEKHKYGYVLKLDDGFKVIRRTNPNAKWDWYVEGGRWSGYFLTVYGKRVDSARKQDIDFVGMRTETGNKARKSWNKIHNLVGEELKTFLPWSHFLKLRNTVADYTIEDARDAYYNQAAKKALSQIQKESNDKNLIWIELDDYILSEKEYVEKAESSAIPTFAVLYNNVWYEKGSMGWWGCVSDEKDQNEWNKQFNSLIYALDDSTLFTIVDCHI